MVVSTALKTVAPHSLTLANPSDDDDRIGYTRNQSVHIVSTGRSVIWCVHRGSLGSSNLKTIPLLASTLCQIWLEDTLIIWNAFRSNSGQVWSRMQLPLG